MSSSTDPQSDPLLVAVKQTNECNTSQEKNATIGASVIASNSTLQLRPRKAMRLDSIDLLRGFIMVVMAWDHSKDYLSRYSGSDPGSGIGGWAGHLNMYHGNVGFFAARGISHICAAGFSYLMGVGMALLTSSRKRKGWTSWQILRFFELRGFVLILFGFIVRGSGLVVLLDPDPKHREWQPDAAHTLMGFWQVMTSLGLQMMIAAWFIIFLEKYKSRSFFSSVKCVKIPNFFDFSTFSIIISSCAVVCFASTAVVINYRQHGDPSAQEVSTETSFFGILWTFLIVPGHFGGISQMWYPCIPWLGICLFGICAADELSRQPEIGHIRSLINGIIFLILFVILRLVGGGVFSFRGWPINGEGRDVNEFISFLHVCKYPPSVTYFLVTIGFDSILLYMFHKISQWVHKPTTLQNEYESEGETPSKNQSSCLRKFSLVLLKIIRAYGRTPLIFYVVHFYYIQVIEVIVYAMQGSKGPGGMGLGYVALVWFFLILPPLYPLCVKYGQFKSKTPPNSLWRLF